MMLREFLLCGASASAMAPLLHGCDVALFDASGIHSRIIEANDATSSTGGPDRQKLRVPIVPASVWTRLTQIVSRQRSSSVKWAVVSNDLALFVPIWKHLMPSAEVVLPAAGSAEDPAQHLADSVRGLL